MKCISTSSAEIIPHARGQREKSQAFALLVLAQVSSCKRIENDINGIFFYLTAKANNPQRLLEVSLLVARAFGKQIRGDIADMQQTVWIPGSESRYYPALLLFLYNPE